MKIIQRIHFFAHTNKLDRLAGHRAHRQGRATASITVHTGQHNTGDTHTVFKGPRCIYRILTSQRISHQQNFMRFGQCFDLGDFGHQSFINRCAASGIEQHHVKSTQPRRIQRTTGNLHGGLTCHNRQCLNRELLSKRGQLLHSGGTTCVQRRH